MKKANAEWYIKIFIQGKKHIVDFLIKFMALASKAQTDDQYTIFLLKKNVERVQKGITYWDKQSNDVLAPNCILKVRGKIIKDEGL